MSNIGPSLSNFGQARPSSAEIGRMWAEFRPPERLSNDFSVFAYPAPSAEPCAQEAPNTARQQRTSLSYRQGCQSFARTTAAVSMDGTKKARVWGATVRTSSRPTCSTFDRDPPALAPSCTQVLARFGPKRLEHGPSRMGLPWVGPKLGSKQYQGSIGLATPTGVPTSARGR